jgi:hypothetical protein
MSIKIDRVYVSLVSDKEYKVILGLYEVSNNKRLNKPFVQFWTHHTRKAIKNLLHTSKMFDYLQEYGNLFQTKEEVNEILVDLLKAINIQELSNKCLIQYMNKDYISDPSTDRGQLDGTLPFWQRPG